MRRIGVAAAVVGLLAAGCGADDQDASAAAAATAFGSAVRGGDAAAACALLTPRVRADLVASEGKPCEQGLPDATLLRVGQVRGVSIWSDRAQVDTADGTVFLAEFGARWLVAAAGCAPRDEAPYPCVVGS